ncbi:MULTISPECIES: aldo/keto reductase [unclassified Rhizobium]|uniref:aldo/keto reductase n=1 Tax=unclassified Rhizobium TaxID=2613769 RepID=UPI001ADC2BDD|nr:MULTISPECIES: aldo/keto reductase [unclassified Rhizobium]MBO9123758.1 aldo/keto reductase [Rhizobium sp. 16-488-2b]MBO9174290.1 aldo/keto reductase [Rhizobium sp. 16-488-2a]
MTIEISGIKRAGHFVAVPRQQRIILGTFALADATQDEFDAVLDTYLESGGEWIDTAFAYGYGSAELKLGSYIRRRGANVRISTKIGHFPEAPGYRRPGAVNDAFAAMQERLGRLPDQILLHEADWVVWWRDDGQPFQILPEGAMTPELQTAPALLDVQAAAARAGIRWGFSGNNAPTLGRASYRVTPDVVMVAKQYDLLWRSAEPLVEIASMKEFDLWLASPFHQSWLFRLPELARFGDEANPQIARGARALEELTSATGRGIVDLAIPFLLDRHCDTRIVVGARSAEEIAGVINATREPLPIEVTDAIDRIGFIASPMKSPQQLN